MLFKYLGKTKVNCQDLIRDYLPTYWPQRKQRAFEAALEKHRTDTGEISVTHVMSNQTEMASAVFEKLGRGKLSGFYWSSSEGSIPYDAWG